MSATSVMTGARMSYQAAMTAARGTTTSLGKVTYVVKDTTRGNDPTAFHLTDQEPAKGGRYTVVQRFAPDQLPPDGKRPWYMGDPAPKTEPVMGIATRQVVMAQPPTPIMEQPMPATTKAAGLMGEAEATVKAVHEIRDMIETLVDELAVIRERQAIVDVSAMIATLQAGMDDAYEATYGILPEDGE